MYRLNTRPAQLIGHDQLKYGRRAGEKKHLKRADDHQSDQGEGKPSDLRKEHEKKTKHDDTGQKKEPLALNPFTERR
jgi:hypothetical protein